MLRAIVLDGMWNKSLAAVRSLGRKGIKVTVGETTRLATALFSKYCQRRLIYPCPETSPEKFIKVIEQELSMRRYALVIPTELTTQLVLTSYRKRLEKLTVVPYAPPALTMKLHDKAFITETACKMGIETPETVFIEDLSALRAIQKRLRFPVVIKPRNSSGSRGLVYVYNPDTFIEDYKKVHRYYPYPLVQERIPPGGDSIGVCLLLNYNSQTRASFVYKRLREYPVEGGPSTLRMSIKNDKLVKQSSVMLEELGWIGVAHVEFKVDPRDGRAKLLEVNPRFWGSLQLAIDAGVDFPYLLFRLATEGDIEPCNKYREGVLSRWLLPGDLLHFLHNPNRFRLRPGFFDFSIKDDIIIKEDLMPLWGRLLSVFAFLFNKNYRKILKRRV